MIQEIILSPPFLFSRIIYFHTGLIAFSNHSFFGDNLGFPRNSQCSISFLFFLFFYIILFPTFDFNKIVSTCIKKFY